MRAGKFHAKGRGIHAMITVLLSLHLFIAIALVAVVLLQRSEGGALGIGGGGGGSMGGLMSSRGTANFLTRVTAILAAIFMVSSLALALLAGGGRSSIVEGVMPTQPAPAGASAPAGDVPTVPTTPSVPLSR